MKKPSEKPKYNFYTKQSMRNYVTIVCTFGIPYLFTRMASICMRFTSMTDFIYDYRPYLSTYRLFLLQTFCQSSFLNSLLLTILNDWGVAFSHRAFYFFFEKNKMIEMCKTWNQLKWFIYDITEWQKFACALASRWDGKGGRCSWCGCVTKLS